MCSACSKNPYDNAIPGGNSLAVSALLGLAALTGVDRYAAIAERTLESFQPLLDRAPQAFAHLLEGLDRHLGGLRPG